MDDDATPARRPGGRARVPRGRHRRDPARRRWHADEHNKRENADERAGDTAPPAIIGIRRPPAVRHQYAADQCLARAVRASTACTCLCRTCRARCWPGRGRNRQTRDGGGPSYAPARPGSAEGTPMHELRLVAVSEDGSYAILAVPGRGGRFSLPIDDRLRTVARGQFSRLAQYEIEVENPLRPKEIQDRIRAGETAEEIADAAGIPPDRVRRFEGPVLAERQYRAQEAQRATIRAHGEAGPGPRLGDIVTERLSRFLNNTDTTEWDSRKRPDGN